MSEPLGCKSLKKKEAESRLASTRRTKRGIGKKPALYGEAVGEGSVFNTEARCEITMRNPGDYQI